MVWPAIIAGAASLAGTAMSANQPSGISSADPQWQYDASQMQRREDYKRQKEFAQMGVTWDFDQKMALAKKYGIHPLRFTAGGTSYRPGGIGTFTGGGKKNQPLNMRMGQDISRAMAATKTREEKMYDLIKLEQEKERLKAMRMQNAGLNQSLHYLDSPDMGPSGSTDFEKVSGVKGYRKNIDVKFAPGSSYETNILPSSSRVGIEHGAAPGMRFSPDEEKYYHMMPSTPNQEAYESSLYHSGRYLYQELVKHGSAVKHYYFPQGKGVKEHRRLIREIRKGLPPAGKGHEWRFNPWKRAFKRYPIGKGPYGSRLYEGSRLKGVRN